MINLIDITDNFNRNKNFIVDILINHYGQKYSEIIKERLENVFFDFSSTPEEEYNFLKSHSDQVNNLDNLLIKLRYKEFKKIKSESQKLNFKRLTEYVEKLLISNFDKVNVESEMFLSLFTDENFNGGYIDAFSSKNINLLNDLSISESIKESIINDQKEFRRIIDYLGIVLENLSIDNVDKLIDCRRKLQIIHRNNIIQKSEFGKDIFEEIRKKFAFEPFPETLSAIAFLEHAWSGYISVGTGANIAYYQIIKIPLLHLINLGIKGLDVNIIHEIIHKVETSGNCVGIEIADDKNTNKIVNELRTQNLAIKITKELHQTGIFMYDNPNNYKIEGESYYEALFPLTKEFLDVHEALFSDCAINNTPHKLYGYFGEYWKEFSENINNIFYSYTHYISRIHSVPNIKFNNIAELINNMESKRKGTKNV